MSKRSTEITDEDRARIRELALQGMRPADIATEIGRPGKNVSGVYYRMRDAGEIPKGPRFTPVNRAKPRRKQLRSQADSRVASRAGSRVQPGRKPGAKPGRCRVRAH